MIEPNEPHIYSTMIIDSTNLFFRSVYRALRVTNNKIDKFEKFCRFPIEDAIARIKDLKDKYCYEDSIIYFLFDNPDSAHRFRRIVSGGTYKHNRNKDGSSGHVYMIMNIFIDMLKCFSDNFRIVSSIGMEADDLTEPVKDYVGPGLTNKCLFVSVDLDWARNIDDKKFCHWYSWHTVYDEEKFRRKYGFYPSGNSIKLYKALKGDEADCIENAVPYLPMEIVIDIVSRFQDIDDLFNNLFRTKYLDKHKLKIKESEQQIRVNYQLVDFYPLECNIEELIFTCSRNKSILKDWCNMIDSTEIIQNTVEDRDLKNLFKKKRNVFV